jgi:DNA-binding IclR family transcriptional regulator
MAEVKKSQFIKSDPDEKSMVRTVWRAFAILDSFAIGQEQNLNQICERLGYPKSSAYEILNTLVSLGVAEKTDEGNNYRLGLKLYELGARARGRLEIRKAALPAMRRLNKAVDETVHLSLLDQDQAVYVECCESSRRVRTYAVIGQRAPLYCTSVGKALLAFLPTERIKEILAGTELIKFTENTITDPDMLLKELAATEQRGYAVDNTEHEDDVRCVGAPIRNGRGEVFASISISGPSQRVSLSRVPELAELVTRAADEISGQMV